MRKQFGIPGKGHGEAASGKGAKCFNLFLLKSTQNDLPGPNLILFATFVRSKYAPSSGLLEFKTPSFSLNSNAHGRSSN